MALPPIEQITPRPGKAIVEMIAPPDKLGSIIIPKSVKQESHEARVIAVGPHRKKPNGVPVDHGVRAGDVVILNEWIGTGMALEVDGHKYLVVETHDILGVKEE